MLDISLGLNISTKSKIFTLSLSECKRSPRPILWIIICSDLNESVNITLKMAFIDTPVLKVPFSNKRQPIP